MVLEFSGDEIIGYIEGPNGMYSHGLCSGKYSLNNNEIVFTDFIMQFSHDWYYTFVSGEIYNSLMKVQIINTISDWEVHNFTVSKTKNGESFSTFSVSVARPGIEPGTS